MSKAFEPASRLLLKTRSRADYKFFLSFSTRWSDNDQYSHINNSVYYHLFDSIINAYLAAHCDLSPRTSNDINIGLVASSHAHFFSPLSFPDVLDLGLRINYIGKSSVTYEVGVFREGCAEPAVVGGYTHVFVNAVSRKTSQIRDWTREGLQRLYIEPSNGRLESKL